jgi:hypothetical protein
VEDLWPCARTLPAAPAPRARLHNLPLCHFALPSGAPELRAAGVRLAVLALLALFASGAVPTAAEHKGSASASLSASVEAMRTALEGCGDSDDLGWPQGWPDDPQSVAWREAGAYRLYARTPGQFVAVGAPTADPIRDVVVRAVFRKLGGPPGGGYGIIVRDEDAELRNGLDQRGRYYVFEVGDRGELGIWRREQDRWSDLLEWTPSDAVRPADQTNELVVRAAGPYLTFLVNGVDIATVTEVDPVAGGVGVFVGGDLNEVALEQFCVSAAS